MPAESSRDPASASGATGYAPARRSRDAARTRRDILAAAAQRFARGGYSQVTLKEVADDIGITPALIVRYYGSKQALFEAVARNQPLFLPPLADADRSAVLELRARAIVAYFEDRTARAPGIALIRSLDLDDGELFREELERRIIAPWLSEMSGPDAEIRSRLIAGLLMGVGLFTVGALVEPDRPPLDAISADRLVGLLAQMLEVCSDPPTTSTV